MKKGEPPQSFKEMIDKNTKAGTNSALNKYRKDEWTNYLYGKNRRRGPRRMVRGERDARVNQEQDHEIIYR